MLASSASAPNLRQCLQLMDEFSMFANIRHHSLVVARVAAHIHQGLSRFRPGSVQPDRHLVVVGALLHDIAKTPCLEGRCDHAKTGAALCRERGLEAVASIVAEHVRLGDFDPQRYQGGVFTAAELVYYADKRVRHHLVVPLSERLAYILERYGKGIAERHQVIEKNFAQCLDFERFLFQWLPWSADEVGAY